MDNSTMKTNKQSHRICPESIEAGKEIARRVQPAIEFMKSKGIDDERCKSCAYREGTLPNKCADTILDALKCGMEGIGFYCHCNMKDGKPTKICHGWVAHRIQLNGAILKTDIPFSDDLKETLKQQENEK